ncbi:helix-turn-helix transcriptional regulator [Streptococcus pluranimalium]
MKANERLLEIFIQLTQSPEIAKKELIDQFGVSGSSIQRDIQTIKIVLEQFVGDDREILMQPRKGVYSLDKELLANIGFANLSLLEDHKLLAILKIIISSRAFTMEELQDLLAILTPPDFTHKNLLKNEVAFYKSVPQQGVLEKIQLILQAISEQRTISFTYTKNFVNLTFEHKMVEMIFFSDMYFYIATANHTSEDDIHLENLNKFRINNMENIKLSAKGKTLPYNQRFQASELVHRTGSFAFYGKPISLVIDFYYDPVYVFDRFPNHRIESQRVEDGQTVSRIRLETNDGYGLKMWLLMQGKQVKVISPISLKIAIQEELQKTLKLYDQ